MGKMREKTCQATVKREDFLQVLQSVGHGLSQKDIIEQSSCFVFTGGDVVTFNDKVACRMKSGLPEDLEGAVPAEKLVEMLQKRGDDEVWVARHPEGILFSQKGWKSMHKMEMEVHLPIDQVDKPEEWMELPDDFCDAVGMVANCVSTDETMPQLTCVHLHPKWMEACDNFHACRWRLSTGLADSILVPGSAIKHVGPLGVTEMCHTGRWIHFRNAAGLVYSCRTSGDEPSSLKGVFNVDGTLTALPKRLVDAAERGNIFAKEGNDMSKVLIDLKPGKLKLRGEGPSGWYEESKKINYEGEPLKFYVSPTILAELVKKHNDCIITQDKLAVKSDSYTYVTVLMRLDEGESAEEGEASDE